MVKDARVQRHAKRYGNETEAKAVTKTTSRHPEQYEPLKKNQIKTIERVPPLIINYELENPVIQSRLTITLTETHQTRIEVNISRLVAVIVKDRKKMKRLVAFREKDATLKKNKRAQLRDCSRTALIGIYGV